MYSCVKISKQHLHCCIYNEKVDAKKALDSRNGEEVLHILRGLHKEGKTVLVVTHDENIAKGTNRIIRVLDGKIVEDCRL